MKPIDFPKRNFIRKSDNFKPDIITNYPLPVLNTECEGSEISQSIWELSDDEIKDLNKTKKIVLSVWGHSYPPVGIQVLDDEKWL